jgi:hypothetical protein
MILRAAPSGRAELVWVFLTFVACLSCGSPRSTAPARMHDQLPAPTASRADWHRVLAWSEDCEQAFQATGGGQQGLEFYRLDDKSVLAEVACALGAYQGSQQYFLVSPGSAFSRPVQAVVFPTYEAVGPEGKTLVARKVTELTGIPAFDKTTKVLKILNRYRGAGDCGAYAVYSFQSQRAVLKEFRAKLDCDGSGAEHPENWPVRE